MGKKALADGVTQLLVSSLGVAPNGTSHNNGRPTCLDGVNKMDSKKTWTAPVVTDHGSVAAKTQQGGDPTASDHWFWYGSS